MVMKYLIYTLFKAVSVTHLSLLAFQPLQKLSSSQAYKIYVWMTNWFKLDKNALTFSTCMQYSGW